MPYVPSPPSTGPEVDPNDPGRRPLEVDPPNPNPAGPNKPYPGVPVPDKGKGVDPAPDTYEP